MKRLGKVERRILEEVVFKRLGYRRRDVLVPPRYGEDAAAVRAGGGIIVASMDPITGSGTRIGWLAVHINANDVAVMGAEPRWLSLTILLPEDQLSRLEGIMEEVDEACRRLRMALITGHTEVTPDISRPIIVGHVMGKLVADRIITSSGARPGDLLVMSKTAAIEGTAILASDFEDQLRSKVPREILERSKEFYERISVLDEALMLAKKCRVSAMHDPTEGGIVGGAYEMAEASGCSFILYEDKVPIAEETRRICEALGCDPLKLMASGSLLAALPRTQAKRAFREVRGLAIIGEFRPKKSGNTVIRVDGSEERIEEGVVDELWRLIAGRGPALGV